MKLHKYILQEASEEHLDQIATLLLSSSSQNERKKWVRWKYLENPAGRARIFVIIVSSSNKIIGILSFLPRIFLKSEGAMRLMQAVDGFVVPEMRGRGLYPKLLKYANRIMDSPIYGFPNRAAERIEIRCGWQIFSSMITWYFPVRAGFFLQNRQLPILSPVLNLLCRLYARLCLGNTSNNVSIRLINKFRHDFQPNGIRVWGERSSAFLNWRFIDHPLKSFSCCEFLAGGNIIGYCVLEVKRQSAELYDFIAVRHRSACMAKLVEYCHDIGLTHILFRAIGLNLWNLGFVRLRPSAKVIGYRLPQQRWVMTFCDSDW